MVVSTFQTLLLRPLVGVILALLMGLSPAAAQSDDIDYDAWSRLAERAESVVAAARASTPALEDLRAQLVAFRTLFAEAETQNAARIASLQSQLEVLGPEASGTEAEPEAAAAPPETTEPPPAEGAEPAPEDPAPPVADSVAPQTDQLAERRAELVAQLNAARAPVIRAQEAFRRADGLIREIDVIIRDRQTEELLERGPTPLSPLAWGEALLALEGSGRSILTETADLWQVRASRVNDNDWLETLLFLALALVLVVRGRRWVKLLTDWLARQDGRGQPIATFLASLGEIAVPFLGVLALTAALTATGLLGVRGSFVLDLVPGFALTILIARWVGGQLFSSHSPYLDLSETQLREGRFYSGIIGLVLALELVVEALADFERYAPGAVAVMEGALVVTGALMLLRIGFMLLRHAASFQGGATEADSETDDAARPDPEEGGSPTAPVPGLTEGGFRLRLERMIGQACVAIAVLAPLAAAVGYSALASFFLFPMLASLGVFAFLLILNRLTRQVYGAIRNVSPEAVQTALWPVLVDVIFLFGALPILALIWGARVSDLTELWTRFLSGVSIGGVQISPSNFLTFAVVFAGLYAATRLLQGALRTTVLPKTKIDPGGQVAVISGLGYVGVFLAALVAITAAGIDLSNIALVAGALSIGIGFGLQTIVSNFVAGIILLIERPVAEGDWIEVNGTMGYVRDISVRATRIETFDRTDVIVPNADLISGMVTNWTRGNLTGRVIVPVGVAYGTDTKRVERILREIAEAHPLVILKPPPAVVFQGFGADSLDFEIRAILRDVNFMLSVKSELNHAIAARFVEEGIEIPFAQRDVWLRNPEALTAKPQADTP